MYRYTLLHNYSNPRAMTANSSEKRVEEKRNEKRSRVESRKYEVEYEERTFTFLYTCKGYRQFFRANLK